MPLKTPAPASRSGGKAKGKAVTPSRAKGKAAQSKAKSASRVLPEPVSPSWWSTLSPERKLDVVGAVMAVVGILSVLILFSAQRSALTGSMLGVLRWMLGWGMYILPVALIVMGMWLILRRIEKLPRLSLERATGIVLFFLWLLTLMHSIVPLEMAEQAVSDGIGGGYIGSLMSDGVLYPYGDRRLEEHGHRDLATDEGYEVVHLHVLVGRRGADPRRDRPGDGHHLHRQVPSALTSYSRGAFTGPGSRYQAAPA
jgi:hypothetical protein